jgi:hypothetical protein
MKEQISESLFFIHKIALLLLFLLLKQHYLMFGFFSVGLLVALRPWLSNSFDLVDDSFSQWNQPIVQQALSQVKFKTLS